MMLGEKIGKNFVEFKNFVNGKKFSFVSCSLEGSVYFPTATIVVFDKEINKYLTFILKNKDIERMNLI